MSSLKTDGANNDWEFKNNDLFFVEGNEEVQILIRNSLKFYYSEWFLDNTLGIPYFEEIFIKNVSPARVDQIFKDAILNTTGILELIEFNLDINETTRELSLTFTARGETGIIEFNEVLS